MNTEDVNDGGKDIDSTLQVDAIHIHDISTDTAKRLIGALMGNVSWKPYTEGNPNSLIIENLSNTAVDQTKDEMSGEITGTLVYGLENNLAGQWNYDDLSQSQDIPFVVTGNTTIRNLTANHGSAVALLANSATGTDFKNNFIRFHQLNISDIHGADMSIGLYGGVADTYVENANINMTGKSNEYDGLYTASVPDFKTDKVIEFAVAGPFLGNIYLDDSAGNYIINGNILADQANHILGMQKAYDAMKAYYESKLDQPGLTEEQKEEMKQEIQQMLQPSEQTIQQFQKHPVGNINLGGHLSLYGDVYAKNGGTVNLHLTNGSTFEGQTDSYTDFDGVGALTPRKVDITDSLNDTALGKQKHWKLGEDKLYQAYGVPRLTAGTINITMDPGSIWATRGKSFINTLNFKNGGLVDMRAENGASINVGKLTGSGNFLMSFSNNPDHSDMLYAKDISEAGVQNIQANLKEGLQPKDLKGMRFATTGGDDYKRDPAAKFKISFYKNQGVNDVTLSVKNEKFDPAAIAINESFNGGKNGMGTYKPGNDYVTAVFSGKGYTHKVPDMVKIMKAYYEDNKDSAALLDKDGNFLPEYMKDETVENPVKDGTNWYIDAAVNTPSNSGKVIKKAAALDYANAVYGVYTDTFNKRLGEARYSADGDGLWARVRHDRMGKENRYDAKDTMTELGYDWTRKKTSFGKHLQGAALDYMTGDADYKGVDAHSDTKRYGLWLYDTRLGKKGHYTDFVAKIGRFSNKFNLQQEDADSVHGDYHDNYGSLSFEYGRKKPLSSSWYIEPQAQMQYTYLGSADYRTSQGSQVHLAGTDSLIGRIGFRLGRDIGDKTTFYLDANAYHEFLGNQDIFANDITGTLTDTVHNDGSWYEAGVGVSTKLNQNTYGFLSFDKGFGPGVEHTWSFEGGLNYKF